MTIGSAFSAVYFTRCQNATGLRLKLSRNANPPADAAYQILDDQIEPPVARVLRFLSLRVELTPQE